MNFPTFKQRVLALYTLSWPIITPLVFLLLPTGLALMLLVKLTPALAILTNVALLIFFAFTAVNIVGFYEFTREYNRKFTFDRFLVLVFLFYPYTILLTIASLRALYRNLAEITVWEKTEHNNTHRQKNETLAASVAGVCETPEVEVKPISVLIGK